jgi:hypothetical protein
MSRLSVIQYGTGLQIKKSTLLVGLQAFAPMRAIGSRYPGVMYLPTGVDKDSGIVAYVYISRDYYGYEIMKDGECLKSINIPSEFTHHEILLDISYEIGKVERSIANRRMDDEVTASESSEEKGGVLKWIKDRIFTR